MKVQKWWNRRRPVAFLDYGPQPKLSTEYIEEYLRYNLVATESCKPPYDPRKSDAKMSGKTTFKGDYVAYPLPEKRQVTKEVYRPPATAMEGVSMYRLDYPLRQGERPQLAKRKDARSIPVTKFNTVPTYTSEYRKWDLQPRESFREIRTYKIPDEKMENSSTSKRDYIAYSVAPRELAKAPNVAFQSDAPLQSETVHRINFVPHKLEPRPPREPRKYAAPTVAMDSSTTFRDAYQGGRAPPAESARPPQAPYSSTEPLATSSEFRDRFVAWPVERPHRHEPDKYKKPPGEIDLLTSHRIDFKHVAGRPAELKRPELRRSQTMPFVGTTSYNTDFRKWQIAKEPPTVRDQSLRPSGKFEGQSTTRLHYVRHSGQPARSCKPDNKAFASKSRFDDNTIYRIAYVPQPMDATDRYPTPDWLKEQYKKWEKQGLTRGRNGKPVRGMTPRATPLVQAVA